MYSLGRLKWILDIIWPFNQHFNLKNQRNWIKQVLMTNFLNDINCILLHWQKKTTLVFSRFDHLASKMSTKCRLTKSGQSGVKCTHNECTKEQSDTKLDEKTSGKKNEATTLNQMPRKSYWITQYHSIEFGPNTQFFQNLIWQVNSIYSSLFENTPYFIHGWKKWWWIYAYFY